MAIDEHPGQRHRPGDLGRGRPELSDADIGHPRRRAFCAPRRRRRPLRVTAPASSADAPQALRRQRITVDRYATLVRIAVDAWRAGRINEAGLSCARSVAVGRRCFGGSATPLPRPDPRLSNRRALRPRVEHPLEVVAAEHDVHHRVPARALVHELVVQLVRVQQPVLYEPGIVEGRGEGASLLGRQRCVGADLRDEVIGGGEIRRRCR
jgi:hypothetical protein